MKAAFLDRDGTIIYEPEDEIIDSVEKLHLYPEVNEAMRALSHKNYKVFIITNQIGLGRGKLTLQTFNKVNFAFVQRLEEAGVKIEKTYFCPHAPEDLCTCRKPKPGMIEQALRDYPELDLKKSFIIGDRASDIKLGKNVGTKTILVSRRRIKTLLAPDYLVNNLFEAVMCLP